jgi:N-acetylglucosamine kinase-like BadF-type ATPase
MSPAPAYVVGVDVGGTKTRILAAPLDSADGPALHDRTVASASWRGALGDPEADAAGLRRLLVGELGEAVLSAPLAVGAHGCENTRQCRELETALRAHFSGPVTALNDSELMSPAMGALDGIGVVVGTGSIATARTDDGELITAGGWGWLLGDEGSAPALVRDATRAVLASLDRGEPLEQLGRRLMAAFDARDAAELALAVTDNAAATAWGDRAPEVFAAAEDGSALAAAVIDGAGEQLALLVRRIRQRHVAADVVVAGGAVIEGQPRLQAALRGALERVSPSIELRILSQPPVTGAVALARRSAARPENTSPETENAHT